MESSLILGCADSLIAHSVYADFLEDNGINTEFFRLFLKMRRNQNLPNAINYDLYSNGSGIDYNYGCSINGLTTGDGGKYDD